jgi:hypothetical protein
MNICPSETIRVADNSDKTSVDQQSKMLCNVIVRATHDLHVNQHKSRSEIQTFLKNDCQQLATPELVQKVNKIIERKLIISVYLV